MLNHQPRQAALYVLTAALMFACMGVAIKFAAARVDNQVIVLFRNLLGLVVLLPWLWRQGWSGLRTQTLGLHLLRATAGLAAMYCFFYAIGRMPLAEAVLLNFSAPLFMPFIAWVWLREPVPLSVVGALLLGFVGVALILKPGTGLFQGVGLVGLAAGLFAALAMVSIRRLTRSEPPTRIVFYFALVGSCLFTPPVALSGDWPDLPTLALLGAVALFATLGQLLMTQGYARAPAAQAAPFTYASALFAALLGWWIWDERLDLLTWAGGALVALAGVLAVRARQGAGAKAEERPEGRT